MTDLVTPPQPPEGSIISGVVLTLALHVGALIVFCVLGLVTGLGLGACIPFLGIGLLQLIWIIPAAIVMGRRGQQATVKGLLLGAGITFLLNATCFGLVMMSLSKGGFH